MKQARWSLLVVAASLVLASPAHAQKKGAKPPAAEPAPAPAGGDEIELDEPAKPADAPETDQPAPAEGGEVGGGAGICAIDPSACPKAADLKAAEGKTVNAEVYAVQQIYALRRSRFEVTPYWSFSLNDQFVSHPGPGLAINYYLTNAIAVGLNGNFYGGLNVDSDFNFENRRATRVAVPLTEYLANGNVNFTYVPIYGKFAGFRKFIFHYDAFLVGGVGMTWNKPIAVIDPDNRRFDYKGNITFNLGIGLRVFLNRWFAVTGEIRDYIFPEQLESTTIPATAAQQRNPETWYQTGSTITNNVQAQLGVSIFFPFSWEYRLPK